MADFKYGCINDTCENCINQKSFSKKEEFCPVCGDSLFPVCNVKGCHRRLFEMDSKICGRCRDLKNEKKEQSINLLIKGGVVALGASITFAVKNICDKNQDENEK